MTRVPVFCKCWGPFILPVSSGSLKYVRSSACKTQNGSELEAGSLGRLHFLSYLPISVQQPVRFSVPLPLRLTFQPPHRGVAAHRGFPGEGRDHRGRLLVIIEAWQRWSGRGRVVHLDRKWVGGDYFQQKTEVEAQWEEPAGHSPTALAREPPCRGRSQVESWGRGQTAPASSLGAAGRVCH